MPIFPVICLKPKLEVSIFISFTFGIQLAEVVSYATVEHSSQTSCTHKEEGILTMSLPVIIKLVWFQWHCIFKPILCDLSRII